MSRAAPWSSISAAARPTSPCSRLAALCKRARCAAPAMPWTKQSSAMCAASISFLIGEANAERIKIEAGSASRVVNGETAEIFIRGRDLRQGKAKTVVLGPQDIAEALEDTVEEIAEFIQRAIEDLPPEVSTDICERGISLSGGGAKLRQTRYRT